MGSIGDRTKNKEKPKLTEKDIQENLRFFFSQPRYKLDNLYVFGWESDCLLLTKSGYWYEFEIKISRSDFKNDFKNKVEKHQVLESKEDLRKPNYFFYVVPEGLITADEVPPYAGLIYIDLWKKRTIIKNAPILHKVKHSPEDLKLADKFYYNMKSAILAKNEMKRSVDGLTEPYKQGLKQGISDTIYAAQWFHVLQCPNLLGEDYCEHIRKCKLNNRRCSMDCDYIDDFVDKIETFLKSKGNRI
jgi:hypothetical protein